MGEDMGCDMDYFGLLYRDAFGLIWMTFEYVWINLYPHINPTNPVNQHRNLD
jgi:hypothetical protein